MTRQNNRQTITVAHLMLLALIGFAVVILKMIAPGPAAATAATTTDSIQQERRSQAAKRETLKEGFYTLSADCKMILIPAEPQFWRGEIVNGTMKYVPVDKSQVLGVR